MAGFPLLFSLRDTIGENPSAADSSPVVFIQRARRAQGEMGTEKGSAACYMKTTGDESASAVFVAQEGH